MECRTKISITQDFPIVLKYAEVPADQECPTPVIGDVIASLKDEIARRCAEGECETGKCIPESPNRVSILRQVGQFSRVSDGTRECFVAVVAEAETRCICEGSTPEEPEDPENPPPDDTRPPDQGNDETPGSRCCFSVAAGAFANAAATAFASATAVASARVSVMISILISIGVSVAAIATAFAFASAIAIAIAVVVVILIIIIVLIVLRIFRTLAPQGRCIELLDIPPTHSLANPQRPTVLWDTLNLTPNAGFPIPDHVDVMFSTDGGATFNPIPISSGQTASNLPLSGAFVWDDIVNLTPGTLVVVFSVAQGAGNNELCRSQLRSVRITA